MKSIKPMRKLRITLSFFGILIGVIFSIYGIFFLDKISGNKIFFVIGSIFAGYLIANFGFYILEKTLKKIEDHYKKVFLDKFGIKIEKNESKERDILLAMAGEFEALLNASRTAEGSTQDEVQQEMVYSSACALAAAIDVKDSYTGKHSESVMKYALKLANKLKMPEKEKSILRIGGLLHDCGKIGIPDEIIQKPGSLTNDEWEIIKNHTLLGSDMIRYIIETPDIESCVRHHHERWDGKGYPDGLSGQSIPFYARIICVADAYHAMTSDRPYRVALTKEQAFEELRSNKGIQFDPELVESFIQAI